MEKAGGDNLSSNNNPEGIKAENNLHLSPWMVLPGGTH
jgi:hypothetical protein